MRVGEVLDGYWSVDFAEVKSGGWYLIDMAEGNKSWHDKECKYARTPNPNTKSHQDVV